MVGGTVSEKWQGGWQGEWQGEGSKVLAVIHFTQR